MSADFDNQTVAKKRYADYLRGLDPAAAPADPTPAKPPSPGTFPSAFLQSDSLSAAIINLALAAAPPPDATGDMTVSLGMPKRRGFCPPGRLPMLGAQWHWPRF
jgi:hypothetical protein